MDREHRGQAGSRDQGVGQEDSESCVSGPVYQIRVKGHLNHRWSDWFDGLAIAHEQDGTSLLTGTIVDQPALYGLLTKIHDLGLSLLSVVREPEGWVQDGEDGRSHRDPFV